MSDEKKTKDTSLENARILQASVMDESSILVSLSNGSSALVESEEIKKLIVNSGTKILHDAEISD